MYVIVGLGNPGKQYENTKHNVGFITVDYLAQKHGIKVNKIKHKALTGEGHLFGEKVMLVKPQTYMNLSGECVGPLASYYDVPIENIIVIYDDIDIPMGSIRIRMKGSAGSHNGMKSVILHIGDDEFPRIRIGVGGEYRGDLKNYVMSGFTKEEVPLMEDAIADAASACEEIIHSTIDSAMQKYNKIVDKDKDKNKDRDKDKSRNKGKEKDG